MRRAGGRKSGGSRTAPLRARRSAFGAVRLTAARAVNRRAPRVALPPCLKFGPAGGASLHQSGFVGAAWLSEPPAAAQLTDPSSLLRILPPLPRGFAQQALGLLGLRDSCARAPTSLLAHVSDVVGVRPQEQMIGVDAVPDIASVQDIEPVRDRPPEQHPGDPVGALAEAAVGVGEDAVATQRPRSLPAPAAIGIAGDLRHKLGRPVRFHNAQFRRRGGQYG